MSHRMLDSFWRKEEVNNALLLAGLGGAEKLRNIGLGFPEEFSELTFRLSVLIFFVIVHALQLVHTNPVPHWWCLTGMMWGWRNAEGWL